MGLAFLIVAVTPGANTGAVVQFGSEMSIWTMGDRTDPWLAGEVALMTLGACEG
jgi:hypothetical protein